jgi:hypothetical protein
VQGDGAAVQRQGPRGDRRQPVPLLHELARGVAHARGCRQVGQRGAQLGAQAVQVASARETARDAVPDELAHATGVDCHDWRGLRHGLEGGVGLVVVAGGDDRHRGLRAQRVDLLAGQCTAVVDARALRRTEMRRAVASEIGAGPVRTGEPAVGADEDQAQGGVVFQQSGEGEQHRVAPLQVIEAAHEEQRARIAARRVPRRHVGAHAHRVRHHLGDGRCQAVMVDRGLEGVPGGRHDHGQLPQRRSLRSQPTLCLGSLAVLAQ